VSNRTLFEMSHDFDMKRPGLVEALELYRSSASREHAKALERFGIRVVAMRHHTGKFVVEGTPDGFPVHYTGLST
jgi:hypothetical protein